MSNMGFAENGVPDTGTHRLHRQEGMKVINARALA
jgi:hypothetical protein